MSCITTGVTGLTGAANAIATDGPDGPRAEHGGHSGQFTYSFRDAGVHSTCDCRCIDIVPAAARSLRSRIRTGGRRSSANVWLRLTYR
ncbi:hypothetical protein GCM10027289_11960 [Tsukamurella serpentis]